MLVCIYIQYIYTHTVYMQYIHIHTVYIYIYTLYICTHTHTHWFPNNTVQIFKFQVHGIVTVSNPLTYNPYY